MNPDADDAVLVVAIIMFSSVLVWAALWSSSPAALPPAAVESCPASVESSTVDTISGDALVPPSYKRCSVCGELKRTDEFPTCLVCEGSGEVHNLAIGCDDACPECQDGTSQVCIECREMP